MIKVTNVDTWGFAHAVRGMRNPMNSWHKSDSHAEYHKFVIGENDLDLMRRLYVAGNEHRKYLRQIFVSMDITAPLYWWKEFDTYKVGTVTNSCSTMHKIHADPFKLNDFSHEHLNSPGLDGLRSIISFLNIFRLKYLNYGDKTDWWQLIQLLPSSYNQRRTVTLTYENVVNIIHQRKNHKLDEWREFVKNLMELPYIREIIGEGINCEQEK